MIYKIKESNRDELTTSGIVITTVKLKSGGEVDCVVSDSNEYGFEEIPEDNILREINDSI